MSKARYIPAPFADDSPEAWLTSVLIARFQEVGEFREAAIKGDDADAIHDIRVALRRLRSVISDLAPFDEAGTLEDVGLRLKRLGTEMGIVRDADVFIEALEECSAAAADPTVVRGLTLISGDFQKRRVAGMNDLEGVLSADAFDDLGDQLQKAAKRFSGKLAKKDIGGYSQVRGRIIDRAAERLSERGDGIYKPQSSKRLHRLRIGAKRLRYTLELFNEADAFKPFIKPVRNLQSHLGDVHDCDVWIDEINPYLIADDTPDAVRAAAQWLVAELVGRRARAYRASLKTWIAIDKRGFIAKLTAESPQ